MKMKVKNKDDMRRQKIGSRANKHIQALPFFLKCEIYLFLHGFSGCAESQARRFVCCGRKQAFAYRGSQLRK